MQTHRKYTISTTTEINIGYISQPSNTLSLLTPMKWALSVNLQEIWRHQHNKWGENRNYCHEIKSVFSRSVNIDEPQTINTHSTSHSGSSADHLTLFWVFAVRNTLFESGYMIKACKTALLKDNTLISQTITWIKH